MRKFARVLLLLLVSGCATVGVENVEQLKPGTKIVPLSLMGDTLAIRHIGTTVFQNERRDLAVPQWQIDKYTEAVALRVIRDGGKFIGELIDTEEARKNAGKLGIDFWTSGSVVQGGPESIIKLAKDARADYVLVIGPSPIGDPFFGTNQGFSGYGIGQRSVFNLKRGLNYLTMRVALLDGKDGKEVARARGFLSSPRGQPDWMDSENLSLSVSNATGTKSSIESLIDSVLRKGLLDLKLAQ